MLVKFISLKDSGETRIMSICSDNIEIIMGSEIDDVIMNFLNLFCKIIKKVQNKQMRGNEFVLDSADLLYYHLHKISLKRGKSYIDSPGWLKNKKATINPHNKDNECFKYAITAALNDEKIKKGPQRISKIKPFISQYEWKNINFPANLKDWKKFERDNKTITLNIFFVPYNTKQIRLAYKSKYNYKRDNQVILLMIADGEKWHYLVVKSLSALLIGITSNNKGDFYCLNCFHSYRT